MAYTYTEPVNGVFADPVSEVRFLLGDTVPAAPFSLSDAEIQYLLDKPNANTHTAASDAAYQMGTRYIKQSATTSKTVGNLSLSVNYGELGKQYYALATSLRAGGDTGLSAAPAYDTDYCEPQFRLGQFDYPGTSHGLPRE